MIRQFRALRQKGRRKSERHAKTWRGRRFYFFSCSLSIQRTRQYRNLEQARLATTSSPGRFFMVLDFVRPPKPGKSALETRLYLLCRPSANNYRSGVGGGGYSTNIWVQVRHEGFEILTLVRKKNPKNHTLRSHPAVGEHPQFYYLFQNKEQNAGRIVLKPFIGHCYSANSRNSHCCCILGVQTKFTQQIKSIVQVIPF